MIILAAALLSVNPNASLSGSGYGIHARMRPPATARIVWRDEFDGRALDRREWTYDTSRNKEGWYNGGRQYYADRLESLRVKDGKLIIDARHETLDRTRHPDWGGQSYTSGKIVSAGAGRRSCLQPAAPRFSATSLTGNAMRLRSGSMTRPTCGFATISPADAANGRSTIPSG